MGQEKEKKSGYVTRRVRLGQNGHEGRRQGQAASEEGSGGMKGHEAERKERRKVEPGRRKILRGKTGGRARTARSGPVMNP